MDIQDLIDFADAWAELGEAVQSQAKRAIDDPGTSSVNNNAIKLAYDRLKAFKDIDPTVNEVVEYLHEHLNYDPSPYCTHCGPKSACDCGPIAEND